MKATSDCRISAPEIHKFPELSLPHYRRESLDNGVLIKIYDGGDSPVNRLTISFEGGIKDVASPAALTILCALMREGAGSLSGEDVSETLDYNGAWLKIEPDNHNLDISLYSMNDHFLGLISLFNDVAFSPSLPEKEFISIKARLAAAAEIQLQNVMKRAEKRMAELFFGEGHPCSLTHPTAADFKKVTIEEVRLLHKRIAASIPTLSLSGMTEEILPLLKANIKIKPSKAQPLKRIDIKANSASGAKDTIITEGAMQSAVAISFPTIPRCHPDYMGLRLAVMALGGYFGSRLMTSVREEKGLTYGISAHLLGHAEGTEIRISSQTDPSYIEALIDATKEEILKLQENPMNPIELEQLKAYAMSTLAATLDSPFSIMDYHTTIERIGAPEDYYFMQQKTINEINAESLSALLKKHLILDDAIIVTTHP